MCGIFGVIDENCVEKTLQALRFLQYRGYDSAGIAVKGKGIEVFKCSGRVEDLQGKIPPLTAGALAIGHTRWATHGKRLRRKRPSVFVKRRQFCHLPQRNNRKF